jgi:hypothetical protein
MPSKIKTCADYREGLMDAAASVTELPLELRSHLDACASCAGAFAQERQLFAAMDSGLRVSANAEVPASLLPRVRAELNERVAPRRSWIPAAAAGLATAAVVVAIVFVQGVGERKVVEPQVTVSAAAQTVQPTEIQPAGVKTTPLQNGGVDAAIHVRRSKAPTNSRTEEVAVLIPSGQKRAMDVLLVSLQQGSAAREGLLAVSLEKPLEELHVAPLDVSPIEVKPLEDIGVESGSKSEKTNR